MKTITYKIVLPEDAVENVIEATLDAFYLGLEGVTIIGPDVEDASKEEVDEFIREQNE